MARQTAEQKIRKQVHAGKILTRLVKIASIIDSVYTSIIESSMFS